MTKTAVVTGGASGIGRRTVERLLEDGWVVWALDISQAALDQFGGEVAHAGRFRAQVCDVVSPASVAAAMAAVAAETDSVDAVICSAGTSILGPLEDLTPEQVDRGIGINLKGPWLTIREALPLLRKNASPATPAHVVILGSINGVRPKTGSGMYSATKAAVHALAGVFAVELAPSGILVNAVAPGSVNTPMLRAAMERKTADGQPYKVSGTSPLGRIAEVDDIADVILFLLSDAARFVTGVVLPVDGGTRAAFVKT